MPDWFTMELVDNNLQKLSAANVLVAGDAMLDRYWLGGGSTESLQRHRFQ